MGWAPVLGAAAALLQLTNIDVVVVTVPPDSRVDIPLSPASGEVEARRQTHQTTLEVRLDSTAPFRAFGQGMRAYVVWAVSPEGEFENLGELELDGDEAELDTATAFQRFGLLLTAEPYFNVPGPAASVAFTSGPPRDDRIRSESYRVDVGRQDYSTANLPPQGGISPRVTQARMAFRIAELEGAAEFAESEFRQARIAHDSMEELLRRQMDADVLDAYVNDAIRLAARAVRVGRERQREFQSDALTRRAESAESDNARLRTDVERLAARQDDADQRLAALQAELQAVREAARQSDLARAEAERAARAAEAEIERLSDTWPPLLNALISAGARQTAGGVLITLAADRFEEDSPEFAGGTREILARLVGIMASGPAAGIRIEAHVSESGPASESLTLTEDRAAAVRDYLVAAGMPAGRVRAEGFGFVRPIPGVDDGGDPIHERVEILVTEP